MFKSFLGLFIILLFEVLTFVICINQLKKKSITQSIRLLGPTTHYKKDGTPTFGGIIILLFSIINFILLKIINNINFTYDDLILLITLVLFGIVGMLDDLKIVKEHQNDGLKAKVKVILEIIFGLIISIIIFSIKSSDTLNIFNKNINLGYFIIIFYLFYIMAWSNSFNLSDGIDGLSSGLAIILLLGVFIIGKLNHSSILVVSSLSIIFSLFGFIIFNSNPALIFMGNIGSHALGAIISTIAILTNLELVIALMGMVYIIETLSVILQVLYFKITHGKRLFKMAPFHHHLELSGYKERTISYCLILFEILFILISISMVLYGKI